MVLKHRCAHQMQTIFPGDDLSHQHKDNGTIHPTGSCLIYMFTIFGRTEELLEKQQICVGTRWRDDGTLNSTAHGRASSAAAFLLGLDLRDVRDLSQPEQGAATHLVLQQSRP